MEKLTSLKTRFVKESSAKVKSVVTKRLQSELSQLHEDVKVARENNFGRRIFEAFATEFTGTHLNENAVIRELNQKLDDRDSKLQEARVVINKAKVLVEEKNHEVKMIQESTKRVAVMEDLLGPLQRDKAEVMQNLLENVQTNRLQSTFEKYLPAVLANKSSAPAQRRKQPLTEGVKKEVTGNKSKNDMQSTDDNGVIDLRRLAGLSNSDF